MSSPTCTPSEIPELSEPFVQVLGVAQDAGHPQAGCYAACCRDAWDNPGLAHRVAALGVGDPETGERWIVDATPDFPAQLRDLDCAFNPPGGGSLSGIVLTHAHIGHYLGLVHLGREAMSCENLPVYATPKMCAFLEQSGPWELLVRLGNIRLVPVGVNEEIALGARIRFRFLPIPHRGEYSDTVAVLLEGESRSVFYLPDIDQWERWVRPVEEVIAQVDRAYLDGTFFSPEELGGRSMEEVPHPLVCESLKRFSGLAESEKSKIHFLHFNHTNPLLKLDSAERQMLSNAGLGVASRGDVFSI